LEATEKEYLGDGVYVEVEDGMFKITTENGTYEATNTIFLEPEVYHALTKYAAKALDKKARETYGGHP